ncbi:MAG TPA: glycoside hydrolase family 38 C-terminal domain-containing protein, partial [Nitrolancea sp.]|nr:glycoside hydrolase family 38 C-terminal domain-containing protein [Nitrolancea sp.]
RVDVPATEPEQAGRRHLLWDCDGETTAWLDGQPWAGLDAAHPTCPLPDRPCTLWLDCGLWESVGGEPLRPIGPYGPRFDQCRLQLRDELAWSVHHDLEVLEQLRALLYRRDGLATGGAAANAPPLASCSPLLRLLLGGLETVCDAWVAGGLPALVEALRQLFARLPAEAWQPVAALCGHAHIDLVWLWPEAVTDRKVLHSFANVLRLMERYPELTFVGSQPALYRKVEQAAPAQMREIAARIAEGRWQIAGPFEVEPDSNLPSGEGLARALVYGQRKIAALTGALSDVCWLPDSFGYSASLPQILALGGVRSFFTTKLTWSQITRFPYTSFVWRGPDGSEVLAHLCPTTYNGSVQLEGIAEAARADQQLAVYPEVLLPTGWGDGGGGPTETMCERARRVADLAGMPRARWATADDFFQRMAAVRERLPVYQGELYLEYHRGTLTTQSEFKRLYRGAETALQAHEAARVAIGGEPLGEAAWLRLLFCQFHDALPGSSIRRVYAELNPELEAIARRELSAAAAELGGGGSGWTAFNPLPLPRAVLVEPPEGNPATPRLLRLGPLERVALDGQPDDAAPMREIAPTVLDNGIVRATFDRTGRLEGLAVDGQPLALAAPGGFVLYHDQPTHFDAWDIDHYTARTGVAVADDLELQIGERGPLRGVLRGSAGLGEQSRLRLLYTLEAESRWLRLEVEVDWHESHRLLRYHVPTAYRGRFARFGSPFGSTLRSQWPGTPADEAMWEVAGSRWAAVTRDDGEGLALLTEAKFGFSCREGNLAVSLLRSPKSPDPEADMGQHRIRLALGR